MISVSIRADVKRASAMLGDIARKQVPFATAAAINDLAFQVQRAEAAGILQTFKHPRPFTQRATKVTKATKASPTAVVFLRPEVAKYLAPYEYGGNHVLPGKGIALLNPIDLRTDQYGQIRGKPSTIAQRSGVFVGTVKGIAGFWQRIKGHQLRLLIKFGNAMPVKQHLDFEKRGADVVRSGFAAAFNAALAKALASARA